MTSTKHAATKEQLHDKWITYVDTRDPATRDFLIEHYLPLVHSAAARMHARLQGRVELDDLISAGVFGMMNAVAKFDPRRGITFGTFSTHRICGAILDEVRSMDCLPRKVRSEGRRLGQARGALTDRLGYKPNECELADHVGTSPEKIGLLQRQLLGGRSISLSAVTCDHDDGYGHAVEIEELIDKSVSDGRRLSLRSEFTEGFFKKLSKIERLILTLYYFEELPLKQIGRTLDLSEGRICQIHSKIIAQLRIDAGSLPRRFPDQRSRMFPIAADSLAYAMLPSPTRHALAA